MNSTLIATTTTPVPEIVVDLYPHSPAKDLRRPAWGARTMPSRTADNGSMTVGALARELGLTARDMAAYLRNTGEFVRDGRAKVTTPVINRVRDEFLRMEIALDGREPHHSEVTGRHACESGCPVYACSCGSTWVGHRLYHGCEARNTGWVSQGCPTLAAQRS